MADAQAAQQQIDAIVQAISFGLANDFRGLRDAMYYYAQSTSESNRVLGDVNNNLAATDRSLDQFEKEVYRQKDARQFRLLEDRLERRSKDMSRSNDEMLNRIYSSIENMKWKLDKGGSGGLFAGGDGSGGGGGGGGTNINVGVGLNPLKTAAVIGGAAVVGAAAIAGAGYLASQNNQQAAPAPTPTPSGSTPVPPAPIPTPSVSPPAQPAAAPASSQGAMPAPAMAPAASFSSPPPPASTPRASASMAPASVPTPESVGSSSRFGAASTTGAVNSATATVGAVTRTVQDRAVDKIGPKIPEWISRYGGRLQNTIGADQMKTFGDLINGEFYFSTFLPGNAWTLAGAEWVAGVTPEIPGGTKEKFVAGVAVTLAIQTYLMCREIYTQENFVNIEQGLISNFDDLPANVRSQAVKEAGNQVESFINSLVSAARGQTFTSGKQAPAVPLQSTTPAGATPAPAASSGTGGGGGSLQPQAAGGGGGGGETPTDVTGDNSYKPPAGTLVQNQTSTLAPGPSTPGQGPSATGGGQSPTTAGARMPEGPASLNTRTDQAGGTGVQREGTDAGGVSEILQVGPGYNVVRLNDGSVVKRQGDRNWRNNNPGNLEYGETAKKYGAIGSDGRFAIFPDKETGNKAREGLLFDSKGYRDLTLGQAIYKYAPPSENNSASYLAQASSAAGVSADTRLSDFTPEQRVRLLDAMERVEGFRQGQTQVLKQADQQQADIDQLKRDQQDTRTKLDSQQQQKPEDTAQDSAQSFKSAAEQNDAAIKPLPVDDSKPSDSSLQPSPAESLAPPSPIGGGEDEQEQESSSSEVTVVDAQTKQSLSGEHGKDEVVNKISYFGNMMQYMFGDLNSEMQSHLDGEVSDDDTFNQTMHPLG